MDESSKTNQVQKWFKICSNKVIKKGFSWPNGNFFGKKIYFDKSISRKITISSKMQQLFAILADF